jgi:penicillin-binding protein 2
MYDRRGRLLVENVPTFVLRILPAEMPFEVRPEVAERISRLTDIPARKIIERLDSRTGSQYEPVRITDITTETARVIAEDPGLFPGVQVDLEARRSYGQGKLMAHVLGWTGRISGPEYQRLKDEGYYPEDLLGKAGLEATYEDVLRGTYGLELADLDRQGHELRAPEVLQEPIPGSSLELTIDTKAQQDGEKALKWAMDRVGIKRGSLIAMNPQNGEILALVSLPSYDNNKFAQGISTSEYRRLLRDPSKPMLNVAINEQYPPGSTYKLVTGTGALADGRISPTTRIMTEPFIEIGEWKYWDWNKEGWGPLDIYGGFGHSSDTFFYKVSGMLGIDRLAYWAHQFGFGKPTGIDLPGEAAGIVPTNEWKERTLNEQYFTGELYQAGIGQGYNMSTPLQVLNAYAALANGGTLYKPQLVRKILDAQGEVVERVPPEVMRVLDIDKSVLRTMRVAARRVVTIRHTYNLVDLPIVVAGKSGTSEFGVRDKQGRLPFSNWFVAFVPKDPRKTGSDPSGTAAIRREDSDLVVLAYLDDTRTRGNVATEVVKYFLQLHYGLKTDLRQGWVLERDNFYNLNS